MKISAGLRGAPFRHGIAAFMAKLTHMDHIGTLHCCPLRAASFRHLYAPGFHSQFVEACVFFGAVLPHQGILPEDISSPNRLAALPSCFSGSPTCRHRKLKLGGLPSLEELRLPITDPWEWYLYLHEWWNLYGKCILRGSGYLVSGYM